MARIVGISGSLRKASFNSALLRAAQRVAPAGLEVDIRSIVGIPPYDGDLEAAGMPDSVQTLKNALATADGLLLVTPEYNGSVPGVLKNAIDWMSRPASDIKRVFAGKPVGLLGASPTMGGTRLSQAAWLPVFRVLELRPWFGKQLYVASAQKSFDAAGNLTDAKVEELLTAFMAGFAESVKAER